MNIPSRKKIVLLGMISKYPVAGVIWQTVHYLLGFERLGFETYYVEAHSMPPTKLMHDGDLDGSVTAAGLIKAIMDRFGFQDRWAFHALHSDGAYYGMSAQQLNALYSSAELIINLHGATVPLPEHAATKRLVYLETDPVVVQIHIHENRQDTLDYLAPHVAFYTYGENYGRPGCRLPCSSRFPFKPTRQPVVLDQWEPFPTPEPLPGQHPAPFTTIGNWRQTNMGKEIAFNGEVFQWSKHFEFEKFISLPSRVKQPLELALSYSSSTPSERQTLLDRGWRVCDALAFSGDLDKYRDYIRQSRGEFTVAKEQNIRLRTGWFSDRAATYLASGRPVITQETGFSDNFPMGEGLFAFSTMEEILSAIETINADYPRARAAALKIAREHFSYEVVLPPILSDLGVPVPGSGCRAATTRPRPAGAAAPESSNDSNSKSQSPFSSEPLTFSLPPDLVLSPLSRLPLRLAPETIDRALSSPLPRVAAISRPAQAHASIVIVTHNGLPYTRLCLTALLASWNQNDELIIVDNASTDGTTRFLTELVRENRFIHLILNTSNRGFSAANNQALAVATGSVLILLNNDTLVPPGWRDGLVHWLREPQVGLVGPVTNRICNEAQIETNYRTVSEMLDFARGYTHQHGGVSRDIRMLAMFCVALRRDVFEKVGLLDEEFGIGMFEDEDYSIRVRKAGYRVLCVDDVFIHHFSQASFGELCANGEFDRLLEANRRRLEQKWNFTWEPHPRRHSDDYLDVRARIREIITQKLPHGATVTIVSKGDEELVQLNGSHVGWHFPRLADGQYPYIYPANSLEAIHQLETLRAQGAGFFLVPKPGFWWLDHYKELKTHLDSNYHLLLHDNGACIIYDLTKGSRCHAATTRPHPEGAFEPLPESNSAFSNPESEITNPKSAGHFTLCSIIIPVFNHANLTRTCLEVLFNTIQDKIEVIVVDDASTDDTPAMLARFGSRIRVVRHTQNAGFAQSCNDGAAAAHREHLVFLNNDTIPHPGWLDHLTRYAAENPSAAVIGAKLLFPNHTIQHAGVAICQDRYPRHIYAGFPENHPAVSKSRRFQVVTAACMLVRRAAFAHVGGFDTAYRNGFEDVDLCLRLAAAGHEIHYCADAVLFHLESASPGRFKHDRQNAALFRERWANRVQPDDIHFYLEDGLMRFHYESTYPFELEISPDLATVHSPSREAELERLLHKRSREVADLVRENARLSVTLRKHAPDTPELQYQALRHQIRTAVENSIPPGSIVAVISKGDNALLDLPNCEGWHFPRTPRGTYLGHHPGGCREAIEHLEKIRAMGARYLLIPATSVWWLDHYSDFREYLERHFVHLHRAPAHCHIFDLMNTPAPLHEASHDVQLTGAHLA